MLRTVKVRQGGTTSLITGIEGRGVVLGVRLIKPASFNGCHNLTRGVSLLVLARSRVARAQGGYMSVAQLSDISGLKRRSIQASVGKWVRWRLIRRTRSSSVDGVAGVYLYALATKGAEWVARHEGHMARQLEAWDLELAERRGCGLWDALKLGLPKGSLALRIP